MIEYPPAHPDDILVVSILRDREDHPQFDPKQVYSTNGIDRLRVGRRFRRVWMHRDASKGKRYGEFLTEVARVVRHYGGDIVAIEDYGVWVARDAVIAEQEAAEAVAKPIEKPEILPDAAKPTNRAARPARKAAPKLVMADDL